MTERITLTVEVTGVTRDDLRLGLEEVLNHIDKGYQWGSDSNDDGDFSYEISNEPDNTK